MQLLLETTAWAGICVLCLFLCLRFLCSMGWFPKKAGIMLPQWLGGMQTAALRRPPVGGNVCRVFFLTFGFRIFVFLAAWLCLNFGAESVGFTEVFTKLQGWDTRHYISLVEQGYTGYTENGTHLFLVFFPLYVWLTRAVCLLLPNTLLAGLLVSTLCYSLGCCYLYRLAFMQYGRRTAGTAVLLLSLFPFSFFFGTFMTESLFFLTVTAACYYALQKRWLLFGIWGALAAMTRMTGLLLILPAAMELFAAYFPGKRLKDSLLPVCKRLPLVLLPLVGSAVYLGLNAYVDGNPFAFLTHQQHWNQEFLFAPRALANMAGYIQSGSYDAKLTTSVWLPQILLFFLCLGLLFCALKNRRNRTSFLVYGFCYLVGNYSLSWLLSGGRYLSCGIVFFLFAAALLARKPVLRAAVVGVEAVFFGIYLMAALNGAPIM